MYIFVLKKTTNTVEGLELAWCGGNLWPLNTYLYLFLQNKSNDYLHIFLHQKSFEKKEHLRQVFQNIIVLNLI